MNSTRVTELFKDCLFKEGEPTDNYVPVEGITVKMGFHPERLSSHKEELKNMIDELHPNFTEGGGWTFLNLCEDRHGNQWASTHQVMQEFYLMCAGNELAKFALPREVWGSMPGGMPYVVFNKEGV